MRGDAPGPGQRGHSGQRRSDAKGLQQEVSRDRSGGAGEIGRQGGGRRVDLGVLSIIKKKGQKQRHAAKAQGKSAEFRHPPGHNRTDGW